MYLGIQGAHEILKVLDNTLKLNLNMKRLDKEIKEIESDMLKRTEQFSEVSKQVALNKLKGKLGKEMDYIG